MPTSEIFQATSDMSFIVWFLIFLITVGSQNDVRGALRIPNIPFSTDTNRYADSITSTGILDVTSPHFPLYSGSVDEVSERYAHYRDYMLNAAEQGVAGYNAGDAEKENARVKITSIPNYQNLPKPSKTFPVYAAIKWNPSDFAIQEGENYTVEVLGDQNGFSNQLWYDGGIRVNADGYESFYDAVSNCHVGLGRCRSHLKKKRRVPLANWMSLACAVGEFVRALQEIQPGEEMNAKWLPLNEANLQTTIFPVGQSVEFRATSSGQLICFANDAHTEYWNNYGFLNVTVTRASWPPQNATYYQQLYKPACDSAQVIYASYNATSGAFDVPVDCNPNGGGAGWIPSNINANSARYESGLKEEEQEIASSRSAFQSSHHVGTGQNHVRQLQADEDAASTSELTQEFHAHSATPATAPPQQSASNGGMNSELLSDPRTDMMKEQLTDSKTDSRGKRRYRRLSASEMKKMGVDG